MEIKEAIREIKNRHKPYLTLGISSSHFSQLAQRAEHGIMKPESLKKFLEPFGYEVTVNIEIKKSI